MSLREIEALQWMAHSRSARKIAVILNIANRTIDAHALSAVQNGGGQQNLCRRHRDTRPHYQSVKTRVVAANNMLQITILKCRYLYEITTVQEPVMQRDTNALFI
jgi:Bacterial regulatory proteins, luxR family